MLFRSFVRDLFESRSYILRIEADYPNNLRTSMEEGWNKGELKMRGFFEKSVQCSVAVSSFDSNFFLAVS